MNRDSRLHSLLLLLCGFGGLAQTPAHVWAAEPVTFEQHVRPILKVYCLDCHGGGEKLRGGLDLRLKRFAEKGGDSGPAVVPRQPGRRLLLARLKAGAMPPGDKEVPPEKRAVLEKWV